MEAVLSSAHDAFAAGDFERAASLYGKLDPEGEDDLAVQKNLIVIALYSQQYSRALEFCDRLLKTSSGARSDDSEGHHLRGVALFCVHQNADAAADLTRAAERAPKDSRLANTLGHILLRAGRAEEAALQFYRAAKSSTESDRSAQIEYWRDLEQAMTPLTEDATIFQDDSLLADCLRVKEVNRTSATRIARARINPLLADIYRVLRTGGYTAFQDWLREHYASDAFQLFKTLIEYTPCIDARMEKCLTVLRAELTAAHPDQSGLCSEEGLLNEAAFDILIALASQCFLNAYAFHETETEVRAAEGLRHKVEAAIANGADIEPCDFALFAAYRPLHKVSGIETALRLDSLTDTERRRIEDLMALQVHAPQLEQSIRSEIPALTPIDGGVSVEVQHQYEENPYPTWSGASWSSNDFPVGFRQSFPTPQPLPQDTTNRVLIAGCGTGQHALIYSLAKPHAHITAMDLSLSSLAYGERNKRELDPVMKNVTFYHGDILRLVEAGQTFDEISCMGVLHHLYNPLEGLKALKAVYSGKGDFQLAVYTESGRQDVVAGIKLREQEGLSTGPADIRRFRKRVYELDAEHPAKSLIRYHDFYSLDALRDLVFNVQEHRYTLASLSDLIAAAGFDVEELKIKPRTWKKLRHKALDQSEPRTLMDWHALEQEVPGIFGSMYTVTLSIK